MISRANVRGVVSKGSEGWNPRTLELWNFEPWNLLRREEVIAMAEVKVQEGESIESALRRFKRKVQQEDIIKDIKKHSFYLKPGDKRRAKQALARKRNRKKMRREAE